LGGWGGGAEAADDDKAGDGQEEEGRGESEPQPSTNEPESAAAVTAAALDDEGAEADETFIGADFGIPAGDLDALIAYTYGGEGEEHEGPPPGPFMLHERPSFVPAMADPRRTELHLAASAGGGGIGAAMTARRAAASAAGARAAVRETVRCAELDGEPAGWILDLPAAEAAVEAPRGRAIPAVDFDSLDFRLPLGPGMAYGEDGVPGPERPARAAARAPRTRAPRRKQIKREPDDG
jgi:hypothetical protein